MSDLETAFENYFLLLIGPRGKIFSWDVPITKCNLLHLVTAFRRAELRFPHSCLPQVVLGKGIKERALGTFLHDHRLPGWNIFTDVGRNIFLNFQTNKVKQKSILSPASKIILALIHIKASSKMGRQEWMHILRQGCATVVILQASLDGLGIQMGPLSLLTL